MARGKIIFTEEQRAFLLCKAAQVLKPDEAAALNNDEAYERFKAIRWGHYDGRPHCPHCGAAHPYERRTRSTFKCVSCSRDFSTTTGTVFRARKLPHRTILHALSLRLHHPVNPHQQKEILGITYKTSQALSRTFLTFLGTCEYAPRNPIRRRVADSRWPFLNENATAAHDLVVRVDAAIPYSVPEQVRADVAQDMILAVLAGDCEETDLEAHVRRFIGRHYRTVEQSHGLVSLNQHIPGTDIERIDTITYEDMHCV